MSQCVPGWDLDDNMKLNSQSNSLYRTPDIPTSNYEVAELTWANGQLSMHGLGQPRLQSNTNMLEKPCLGGTLESIVDQATFFPSYKVAENNDLVPWFNNHKSIMNTTTTAATVTASASATGVMDALVPCTNNNNMQEGSSNNNCTILDLGLGTRVESCSGATVPFEKVRAPHGKMPAVANEWSSCPDNSVTESATFCKDSRQQASTCEKDQFGAAGGFTSTSMGSPGNTSSGKQWTDEHDSICHSKPQRETVHDRENKEKTKWEVISFK